MAMGCLYSLPAGKCSLSVHHQSLAVRITRYLWIGLDLRIALALVFSLSLTMAVMIIANYKTQLQRTV